MRSHMGKAIPTITAATLGLMIGGTAFLIYRPSLGSDANHYEGKMIPKEGLLLNEQGTSIGDPENAYKDLRRIYKALVAFRARFDRMPRDPWELLEAGRNGI